MYSIWLFFYYTILSVDMINGLCGNSWINEIKYPFLEKFSLIEDLRLEAVDFNSFL
jgi:hypothetical protein